MLRLFLLLPFLFVLPAKAITTDEIIISVQRCIEQGDSFSEIEDTLSDLPIADLKALSATFEKAWGVLEKRYLQNYTTYVQSRFKGSARSTNQKRVRELRDDFHSIRALPEEAMKSKLKEVSMPALQELRTLLMPEAKDLLAEAPDQ